MKRTTLAIMACLLCACGASGIKFNGGSGDTNFLQPRTEAIPHFPLPSELFDPVEQKWSFFVDVDGDNDVFDEDIFTNGRAAAQQALETGNLPSGAPNFSIPVSAPVPLTYAGIFRVRPNTDAWVLDGDWINYDDPMSPPDETQLWGNAVQFRAGALSFVCQWFLLTVDGCPRFQEVSGYAGAINGGIPVGAGDCSYTTILPGAPPSTPETMTYEDVSFQSMAISFSSSGQSAPPNALWSFTGSASNKSYPVDTTAITISDSPSRQQNRVDTRIKYIEDKTGAADEVLTNNLQADRWNVATAIIPGAIDPDLNTIFFDWAGFTPLAPPPIKYGAWREVPSENLFIESDYSPGPATLSEVPTSNYFFASGTGNIPGGVYFDRVSPGDGTLNVYLPTTNTEAVAAQTYYIGVVLAHVVGLGVGFQESTFAAPGVSDGEEDLMNVNVETDLVFFMAAGRRLQFPSTTLLLGQNVVDYPHGSQERTDAQLIGDTDALDPNSIYMRETLPGPMRQ